MVETLVGIVVVVFVWLIIWPTKRNSETFPYPYECWDCKKSSCEDCEVIKEKEVIK